MQTFDFKEAKRRTSLGIPCRRPHHSYPARLADIGAGPVMYGFVTGGLPIGDEDRAAVDWIEYPLLSEEFKPPYSDRSYTHVNFLNIHGIAWHNWGQIRCVELGHPNTPLAGLFKVRLTCTMSDALRARVYFILSDGERWRGVYIRGTSDQSYEMPSNDEYPMVDPKIFRGLMQHHLGGINGPVPR